VRLSPEILVQRIDDDHVVIIDQSTGQEIVISAEIALRLMPAMQYFFPANFVDITPLVTEVPT
jgi:hypothetical protein